MTRSTACIASVSVPRPIRIDIDQVCPSRPSCARTMRNHARIIAVLWPVDSGGRVYFTRMTSAAVQLYAEADAARLRSAGRAGYFIASVTASRLLHFGRRNMQPLAGNRRAATASARGPWPHSLA